MLLLVDITFWKYKISSCRRFFSVFIMTKQLCDKTLQIYITYNISFEEITISSKSDNITMNLDEENKSSEVPMVPVIMGYRCLRRYTFTVFMIQEMMLYENDVCSGDVSQNQIYS